MTNTVDGHSFIIIIIIIIIIVVILKNRSDRF